MHCERSNRTEGVPSSVAALLAALAAERSRAAPRRNLVLGYLATPLLPRTIRCLLHVFLGQVLLSTMYAKMLQSQLCILWMVLVGATSSEHGALPSFLMDAREHICVDADAPLIAEDALPLVATDTHVGGWHLVATLAGATAIVASCAASRTAFARSAPRAREARCKAVVQRCAARLARRAELARLARKEQFCAAFEIQRAWRISSALDSCAAMDEAESYEAATDIQAVTRGMLARRTCVGPAAATRAHLARRRAWAGALAKVTAIQAAARGHLARSHKRRASQLATTSSSGVSTTLYTPAVRAVDRPTMATEEGASSRRHGHKRGGEKGRAAKAAAASALPKWPEALPGVINFRTPGTWCPSGPKIVTMLFPYMKPMADFQEAKCDVLRKVIVTRIERVDAAPWAQPRGMTSTGARTPSLLLWVLRALMAEDAAKRSNPAAVNFERYSDGLNTCSTTKLTRFLGDYLKSVEAVEALAPPRADLYKDFARVINKGRVEFDHTDDPHSSGSEDDDAAAESARRAFYQYRNRNNNNSARAAPSGAQGASHAGAP